MDQKLGEGTEEEVVEQDNVEVLKKEMLQLKFPKEQWYEMLGNIP